MTEKGIRAWWHPEDIRILLRADKREGEVAYNMFTDQQLAELKQEIWDAAREINKGEIAQVIIEEVFKHKTLSDYESKKGGQE